MKQNFPNMAKLIRIKRHQLDLTQFEIGGLFSGNFGKVAQGVSNIERGIASVPLKRANVVCEKLNIQREEFLDAYLKDCLLRANRELDRGVVK